MKTFAIAFSLLASVSSFAATADLSIDSTLHKLVDVEFKLIPTKTEVRDIPGCNPYGEAGNICTEVVVLETRPAIVANVSYKDGFSSYEGNESSWLALELDMGDFDAADIEALKAAYPTWKHPFSNAGRNFAKRLLKLEVKKAQRTIQIVDVRNSKLCPVNGESGEPVPGCREVLVYKPATTFVKEVTVSKK